jgi:transposase, IS5 family
VGPVFGHINAAHRIGRNQLADTAGVAINAVLAAAGDKFRRLLAWLAFLLAWLLTTLDAARGSRNEPGAA